MDIVKIINTLWKNLHGYDFIIVAISLVNFFVFLRTKKSNKKLLDSFDEQLIKRKENGNKIEVLRKQRNYSEAELMEIHFEQDKFYGYFVNIISIFPLLGMIGTVLALISLDLNADNVDITNNFFSALTSTFWGAFFGFLFKLLDSGISSKIEKANEKYNLGIQRKNLDLDGNGGDNEK